jgi:20S proteasome subunit beta 4
MTDTLFGVVGKDCVVLCADSCVDAHGIIKVSEAVDKIYEMDSNKLIASAGPQGDRTQFMEYVQKNIHLYRLRNSVELSTKGMAHFTRSELARLLRSAPHQVDLLAAGWDEKNGPQMFFLDAYASMGEVKRAAHGYGGFFTLGLLDKYWKPGLTEGECLDIIHKCIMEAKTRFTMAKQKYTIKVVDKDGIRTLPSAEI